MAKELKNPTAAPQDKPAEAADEDARSRNIWNWNDQQLDSTTIMLKSLENDALALEPTGRVRVVKPGDATAGNAAGGAAAGDAATGDAAQSRANRRSRERRNADQNRRSDQADDTGSIEASFNVPSSGGFDPYNRS